MNTYIWCAVGLIAGGIVAAAATAKSKVQVIETVTMGIFGAVLGGDLVASLINGPDGGAFRASALLYSVVGAGTMLGLLMMMRKSVGPLRPGKEKRQR